MNTSLYSKNEQTLILVGITSGVTPEKHNYVSGCDIEVMQENMAANASRNGTPYIT
ncbi:hypothetical protein [Photobacterium indicum]|uniref:hypothetical protein n=1 Tax=Photobacterium indicum TaxID=81447 RepID=UPI003D146064